MKTIKQIDPQLPNLGNRISEKTKYEAIIMARKIKNISHFVVLMREQIWSTDEYDDWGIERLNRGRPLGAPQFKAVECVDRVQLVKYLTAQNMDWTELWMLGESGWVKSQARAIEAEWFEQWANSQVREMRRVRKTLTIRKAKDFEWEDQGIKAIQNCKRRLEKMEPAFQQPWSVQLTFTNKGEDRPQFIVLKHQELSKLKEMVKGYKHQNRGKVTFSKTTANQYRQG